MTFEALTAHRRIASGSVIQDARVAVDAVLGQGAVDFSKGNQTGEMFLLSGEEVCAMHRATDALSNLSMRKVVQTAAAFMPSTFRECSSVVPGIAFRDLEEGGRSMLLSFSRRGRFAEERRAFTDAIDRIALTDIPWPRAVFGIDLGVVDEEADIEPTDVQEITGRLPERTRLLQGETAIASLPLAA